MWPSQNIAITPLAWLEDGRFAVFAESLTYDAGFVDGNPKPGVDVSEKPGLYGAGAGVDVGEVVEVTTTFQLPCELPGMATTRPHFSDTANVLAVPSPSEIMSKLSRDTVLS